MTRVIKNGHYVMDFRRPDTITGENNDIKEIHRGIGRYSRYISHNGCYTPLHSESSTGQRRKEKKNLRCYLTSNLCNGSRRVYSGEIAPIFFNFHFFLDLGENILFLFNFCFDYACTGCDLLVD